MRVLLALCAAFVFSAVRAAAGTVMVQNYEQPSSLPNVWVVNMPNGSATAELSREDPHEGKQCVKVHYRFTASGGYEYLGVANRVRILKPVSTLRYWIRGDMSLCPYGVQITDAGGETHQYSLNTGQGGVLDFSGWREVVVDLNSNHEIWGGDKNSQLDFPITAVTFTLGQPKPKSAVEGDVAFDALSVDSDLSPVEVLGLQISVVSPPYCSEVKGNTRIVVSAPGARTLTAKCWKPGGRFGADSTVATIALNAAGEGSFVFPADAYPHGPVTVRISGQAGSATDNCYLQLYNRGGVHWREGAPKSPPPGAKGLRLIFSDDFAGPLSISSTDPKATYYDHKPPDGSQDFSTLPFTGYDKPNNPFHQVDTYVRIRASEKARSAGILSSLKPDGSGITARVPCYFECRFIGPNAIGTWPAFWLLTVDRPGETGTDELDIIEAYGGEGPGSPNADDTYMITPHAWNQGEAGKALEKQAFDALHNPCHMRRFGIPSTWFEAFHTYGCLITETDTVYYCDDIEVGRHATLPLCKQRPLFFMVNLATGGGWPVDLSRYDGLADMYVDYVRVWAK